MSTKLEKLINAAGGNGPADLFFKNARIVNVFTGKVERGSIAVAGGYIAGIGDNYEAKHVIDLKGHYLLPGFIDGHVHIESSMLDVAQYARAVVPCGTTSLVTDLHEIANVCGLDGISYVLEAGKRLPLDIFLMAPSCVPATNLETSGANLGVKEIRQLLRWKQCIGLGEVMNYPGVIRGDKTVFGKIAAAKGKVIDGHAPGLTGKDLDAYIAAGIQSDHESVTLVEAQEKLKLGMHIMIREGSTEKNLEALLPLTFGAFSRRCMFVVDDRSCTDLLRDGDIDAVVRKAIRLGLDPVKAIQLATINTAAYFKLERLGAIAPGYFANFIVTTDLKSLPIDAVYYRGKLVGQNKKPLFDTPESGNKELRDTVKIKLFDVTALKLKARGKTSPVIEIIPGQIVTQKCVEKMRIEDGLVVPDVGRDILKLVVLERHKSTGNIGLGVVKGFGLKRGAIVSSVAHDSHNIIAVGTNDSDIYVAVKEIEKMHGGLAVVSEGQVRARLPLPVAGLLSDRPLEETAAGLENVEDEARKLGVKPGSPFSVLSFLALPVIPELRLTDLGNVDVNEFRLI